MDGRDSGSNFFLPLRGDENKSRLEAKFEHYEDSEEDSVLVKVSENPGRGKVSDWKPSPQSPWIKSPTKSSRKCAVAVGGQVKKKGSPYHRKVKKQPGHVESMQPDKFTDDNVQQTRKAARKAKPADSQEITQYSSEEEMEAQDGERLLSRETTLLMKQSPKTPKPSGQSRDIENKFIDVWNEFSESERPSLSAEPVSAKVDFLLSGIDASIRVAVPASINQYLRDYQREGIRFFYQHYDKGLGAILGDDMGLGKTVQVIGLLAALLGKTGKSTDTSAVPKFIRQMSNDFPDTPPKRALHPFLIIGPAAVLYNWLDELNTWGYFTSGRYHGSEKELCLSDVKRGKLEVVVTTFETFRDNVEQLNQIDWEAVIVDEVHKIKGLNAQVTQALRIIKTSRRFGLTGTALQNNMRELWSLLDWAQPKVLGTLEQFESQYVRAIETGQRHDATKRELALARKQRDKFAVIRRKMMLRRTKSLIADQLPKKEELVVMCRPAHLQVSVYRAILDHPDMALVLQAEDPCDCGKHKKKASCRYKARADGTKVWSLVFSYMHLMLKAANHVGLLIPTSNIGQPGYMGMGATPSTSKEITPAEHLAWSVFQIAFRDYPQYVELTRSAAFRTLSDPRHCGKMKILQGLLRVFEKNHDKVLIFSYSTKLLDIIEHYIISQGHEYSRIDGKVSAQRRREVVIKFNTDPNLFICLISTKAGGLGLNLTGANRVVIFDPNWNPSHDLQAQDRAYRIGQTRDVKVFRLISAGTMEENIYLRQIYKQNLLPNFVSGHPLGFYPQQLDEVAIGNVNAKRYFHGIQGDKNNQGELFGVKNMFALRTGDVCLTMDILKRNDELEKGLQGFDITRYVPSKQEVNAESNDDSQEEEEDEGETVDENSNVSDCDDVAELQEKEADESFLRNLFGSDYTEIRASTSAHQQDESNRGNEGSSDVDNALDDDDNDDEFSLIPTTIRKYARHGSDDDNTNLKYHSRAQATQERYDDNTNLKYHSRAQATQETPSTRVTRQASKSDSLTENFDDLFSRSGITFSTARASTHLGSSKHGQITGLDCDSPHAKQLDRESKQRSASLKKSGISWLFFESDDDDSENESEDLTRKNRVENSYERQQSLEVTKDKTVDDVNCGKEEVSTNCVEKRKKVRIVGENSNQNSETKGKVAKTRIKAPLLKQTFSTEQSLLAASDVLHSHTNRGVLGASRAEDHMTRCAIKDVYELHTNSQAPALACDPLLEMEDEDRQKDKPTRRGKKVKATPEAQEEDYDRSHTIRTGSCKLLVGQTPPAIARKQWSELAKSKGLSELDLARYVLKSCVADRLTLLRQFYTEKHKDELLVGAVSKLYTSGSDLSAGPNSKAVLDRTANETENPQGSTTINKSTPKKEKATDRGSSSSSKRVPTSFFLEMSTLASDSQESITASSQHRKTSSPGDNGSSDSEDDNKLAPISPPPKKRLTPHPAKTSPAKLRSTHTTRLRSKKEGMCRGNGRSSPDVGENFGTNQLDVSRLDLQACTASFLQNIRPDEDIPSLLYEMGGGGGGDGNILLNRRVSPCSDEGMLISDNQPEKPHAPSTSQFSPEVHGEHTRGGRSSAKIVNTPSKYSPVKRARAPANRRDPVKVLDDIFGESFSQPFVKQAESSEVKSASVLRPVDRAGSPKHKTLQQRREDSGPQCRYKRGQINQSVSGPQCGYKRGQINQSISGPATASDSDRAEYKSSEGNVDQKQKLSHFKRKSSFLSSARDCPGHQGGVKKSLGSENKTSDLKYNKSGMLTSGRESTSKAAEDEADGAGESDIFDAFLTTNTLREETQVRKPTRSATAWTKGAKSRNVESSKQRQSEDEDFDNLERWGMFAGKDPPLDGSESLFS